MAAFDQDDLAGRLLALLPQAWFGDAAKAPGGNLWAVLEGFASGHEWMYQGIQAVKANTRILTAIDVPSLQAKADDFFGPNGFPPLNGESLAAYRARILAHFFIPGGTRQAIIQAVTNLTGKPPISIVEPWNPADCGGWDAPNWGWDVQGHWGSLDTPYQGFVQIQRPSSVSSNGQPYYTAWDGLAGWDTPLAYFADLVSAQTVPDSTIYAVVAAAKAEGTVAWVQLQ